MHIVLFLCSLIVTLSFLVIIYRCSLKSSELRRIGVLKETWKKRKRYYMISARVSKKISILSFVLFIGVMTIHTYNLEVYGIDPNGGSFIANFETFLNHLANGTCVSFFFLISGFLFFHNFDMSKLWMKYKSRIQSIVIPYVIWTTLYYLLFVSITRIPAISNVMSAEGKLPFGLVAYFKYLWDGYYTLWFLRVLMWMIFLTPIWFLLLKRRPFYRPELALILLLLIGAEVISIPNVSLNVYYIIGAYLGMNFKKLVNWENNASSITAIVLLPIVVMLGGTCAGKIWYNCLLFADIWLAMNIFTFTNDVKWWVKCTFFYYCAHDMVLQSVEKIILIVGGKSYSMAIVDFFVAPMVTLLILIFAAYILRRWMPLVWRMLSGGRGN